MATWVFDHEPTREEMIASLSTIPAWAGSDKMMDEYVEYVFPHSGRKKIYKDGKEKHVTECRLYMTVHGRICILRDAHRDQQIIEAFEEEWRAPWVIVHGTMTSPIYGTVCDAATAWIGEKAKGADKTNPIENAYTSLRGRLIAALCGGGIIPASGVASAEEIKQAEHREGYENKSMMATVDASSPAVQQQVSNGDNPVVKGIVDGIEAKAGPGFEAAAKQWLQDTGHEIPDGQTAKDVLLTLDTTELGKAFQAIVKSAAAPEEMSDAQQDG